MSPHTSEEKSPVKSGDLVSLDYELWAEGGGRSELIDTTKEEVAQQAEVPKTEGQKFGPHPHLIGGEYFPSGIEAALEGAQPGVEFEKEFAPADGFGERDPKLIELFSMHEISRLPEMRRDDAHLDIGTVLNIRGRRGRVVSLTAARVRVDFNPPFSGRKIRGKFHVVGRIEDPAEQVKALVELTYGRSSEFHVEIHDKTITLKVPDRSKFDFNWVAAKPRVIDRLRTQLSPHTIRLVEEYVTPTPEKKETSSKGGEAPTPAGTETKEKSASESEAGAKPAETDEMPESGKGPTHAHRAKSSAATKSKTA
jgi:FKBP-type peptidyl-prolyl cis-trans isomerase 2